MLMFLVQYCYNTVSSFSPGTISRIHPTTAAGHWKDGHSIAIQLVGNADNENSKEPKDDDANDANDDDEIGDGVDDFDQEIKDRIIASLRQSPMSIQGDGSTDDLVDAKVAGFVPLPETKTAASLLISEQEEASFRRQERELLYELLKGDDAVAKLRQLWFSERGPEMQALLYVAEACIGKGSPEDWTKAELVLLELVQKDPTFLEPFVRLSKLYTLQGRFADSHQICLEFRPWHYVVLETMVVNTMVLEHNQDLKEWASKRLPPPSHSERRSAWVKHVIADSIRLEEESSLLRKEQEKRQKGEEDNLDPDTSRRSDNQSHDWQ